MRNVLRGGQPRGTASLTASRIDRGIVSGRASRRPYVGAQRVANPRPRWSGHRRAVAISRVDVGVSRRRAAGCWREWGRGRAAALAQSPSGSGRQRSMAPASKFVMVSSAWSRAESVAGARRAAVSSSVMPVNCCPISSCRRCSSSAQRTQCCTGTSRRRKRTCRSAGRSSDCSTLKKISRCGTARLRQRPARVGTLGDADGDVRAVSH